MASTIKNVEPTSNGGAGQHRPRRFRLRRWMQWVEHLFAAGALTLLLLVASPILTWVFNGLDRESELRPAKYIICLGGDGARVIESARLLQEGFAEKLVVSNHGPAAFQMRGTAIEWGAPADRVLVDDRSVKTWHHPGAVQRAVGLDPANDVCIIVTSYTHMARSKACFEKAGYRHIIMREPRWERDTRDVDLMGWKGRFFMLPYLFYEGAAWVEYWVRGVV